MNASGGRKETTRAMMRKSKKKPTYDDPDIVSGSVSAFVEERRGMGRVAGGSTLSPTLKDETKKKRFTLSNKQ